MFILSGQSNMQGHRPDEAFSPNGEKGIWGRECDRGSGCAGWTTDPSMVEENGLIRREINRAQSGDLYNRLMSKVKPAIKGEKLGSISFVWMQGERDAKMGWGKLYGEALIGLHAQFANDLKWKKKDLGFVIGRLSDFDMNNKKYPHWSKVREAQVQVANANPSICMGGYG